MTTNSGWEYRDAAMLQLFYTEVETQVALLNDGLLALERDPHATGALAALMRAAHSIKGAARVVQIGAAEHVAHALEECFVAAQDGRVRFTSEHIEVLLRGIDTLARLAQDVAAGEEQGLLAHEAEITPLLGALATLLPPAAPAAQPTSGEPIHPLPAHDTLTPPARLPTQSPPGQEPPVLAQSPLPEPGSPGRVLRVTAESLHRLLGLAGESLVEARWLQPFTAALLQLKRSQVQLADSLEKLQDALHTLHLPATVAESMQAARRQAEACRQMLAERLTDLELYGRRAESLADRLYGAALASHMRPFADGVQGFPRMVRDLARQLGKQVKLDLVGQTTEVDRDILERLEAPLSHLLRNAIDHGLETPAERLAAGKPVEGTIRLEARHQAGMLSITVADDGRGVDVEHVRQTIVNKRLVTTEVAGELTTAEVLEFLFLPAFSTAATVTELSGRGVGLDVVRGMVQSVGGTVRAVSEPGKGLRLHLQLPLTLSVLRALLVDVAGEPYAFPLARLERALLVSRADLAGLQEDQSIMLDEQPVGLVSAHHVLGVPEPTPPPDALSVIVASDQFNRYGLVVDRFLGETDLVVQPLDARLGKIPDISAAALLDNGSPVLIVDVEDMVRSAHNLRSGRRLPQVSHPADQTAVAPRQRILVVDDSLTVRAVQRQILEQHGYEVDVAVDGMDGWNAVRTGRYDLVITDVDMPRLDGIELVRRIRREPRLQGLPVLVVSYKGRAGDHLRGLEAGAQAYFTKGNFHHATFLQAVADLLGASRRDI
jgi:two-component system sensor histidine kinase and response regulator WspE